VTRVVLDASALIGLLRGEAGHEVVAAAIESDGPAMSAVNLAEVASKLADEGADPERLRGLLLALDITVVAFDQRLALLSGELRSRTRQLGLSLGDRACLSLAKDLGVPALTSDRVWALLDLGIEIQLARP
jgi:PIN domain nuclease of toxin-antitoxin system